MADEIWIKHNLGTFQQPYIFQQNRNKQSPTTGQAIAQTPAIARQPSTYQKQSPYSFRSPVNYQQPNIRNAQNPVIRSKQSPYIADAQNPFIRNAQTAFTYNHRSPGTYRVPVDYQTPFTYNYRSPGTYRSPVNYRLPFTYQYQSPGHYRSSVSKQSPYTVNAGQPVIYSHRSPYIFNMWGTPGGISTNANRIFNGPTVVNDRARDVVAATTLRIQHFAATNTVSFAFIITSDGDDTSDYTYTTNAASVTYSGTLNSLEARFSMTNIDVELYTSNAIYSRVYQAHDTGGVIDAGDVSGTSSQSVSGAETVTNLSSNAGQNQTFNTAWANLGTSGTGYRSLMLYIATEGATNNYYGSSAEIGSDSSSGANIKVQLRANGDNNDIVTLYTKTGIFSMLAYSYYDDDTS